MRSTIFPLRILLALGLVAGDPLIAQSGTPKSAGLTAQRQVAITIDDLPEADGHCESSQIIANTEKLLAPIHELKVPVVGFVIGERCHEASADQRRLVLKMWLDAGAELGNHTWSHPDINQTPLASYEAEVLRTDEALHSLLGSIPLRYFRAPYLHDGPDDATKQQFQTFLRKHGYQEAPVTLDNNDWTFAAAYNHALKENDKAKTTAIEEAYIAYMLSIVEFFEKRSVEVFGRECPQVLLIHASKLNAKMLPVLLAMFQARAYEFVSLEKAMSDPIYRTPNVYTGRKGLSWIHRWGLALGDPIHMEPDEPSWVDELAKE